MAQLSSVIGSILRDIISAQHEANLYSISLSESYGKDGKAKDFQLPNVAISDMELELKYAVTAVLTSDIQRNEEDKRFFYHLKQEDELNRKFHSFLSRNMRNAFNNRLYESLDTKTGKVLTENVCKRLMDVVCSKFLDDTDLENLFKDADGKALRQAAEDTARNALQGLVTKQAEDANFKRTKTFPKIDVAVTAAELEKLPEEAIHTFRLKFSPVDCHMTEPESEEELEDFVMQ